MARVINYLEHIMRTYQTAIMLVHHSGKNEKNGSRGASSIRANLDYSFVVKPTVFQGIKYCELSCEKQKDASDSMEPLPFCIQVVELDELDKKGNNITGACVVPVEGSPQHYRFDVTKLALETFMADKAEWQSEFIQEYPEDIAEDSKKRRFRNTVNKLQEDGLITEIKPKTFILNNK